MLSTYSRPGSEGFLHLSHELELASHPRFGSAEAIGYRVLSFYHRGVDILARTLQGAEELREQLVDSSPDAVYRVLGDPAVRGEIGRALLLRKRDLLRPDDPAGPALSLAARYLDEDVVEPTEAVSGASFRVGKGTDGFWVWPENAENNLLSNSFRVLFEREIAGSVSSRRAILRDPTPEMTDHLSEGHALLLLLLPQLSRSLLNHVHLVGVLDFEDRSRWSGEIRADLCQNVSTHAIPGTIFLSPTPLRDPWRAAEALFHEACHKKLSDLVLISSVFRSGFAAASSPSVLAVWNPELSWNSNRWSIDRALFALHFYVHLALFHRAVGARALEFEARFGTPPWPNSEAATRSAFDRARYLARQIRKEEAESLAQAGKALLDWLDDTLSLTDPNPPMEDPTLALALDRFDQETSQLRTILRKIPEEAASFGSLDAEAPYEEWQIGRIADHLIHSTVVSTYRLLALLGEPKAPSFPFYHGDLWSIQAASGVTLDQSGEILTRLRTFISSTVRVVPEDQYARTTHIIEGQKTFKDLVLDMVEHAGRHKADLVAQARNWRSQLQRDGGGH